MSYTSYISVDDFKNEAFLELFSTTAKIKHRLSANKAEFKGVFADKMVGMMFYEPSTRTSGSFGQAITLLGGMLKEFDTATSSIAKGESLDDTARMVAMGCNLLVVRHDEAGTCRHLADDILNIPVINAGEGTGEHPTQALLDMFTIWEKFGRTDVKIGLYGDLLHGRTAHSLIKLGARLGANFVCIEPRDELKIPKEYVDYARSKGAVVEFAENAEEVVGGLDVLYTTRLQKERGAGQDKIELKEGGSGYGVTPKLLKKFNPNGILMHPLPRVDELDDACDSDPRAWYFKQAENGIYTRMALMAKLLKVNLNLG